MNPVDHALSAWAEWLAGLWIFGAAFFYFVRMAALFYRTHEAAITALFF